MVVITDVLQRNGCLIQDNSVDYVVRDLRSKIDWIEEEKRVRAVFREVRRQLWDAERDNPSLCPAISDDMARLSRYLQKICKKLGKK